MQFMDKNAKIDVAGHRGLVGSAIVRNLTEAGYTNLLLRTHAELDLTHQVATAAYFETEKPDDVFLAAAKVGGILANNVYPAEFIRDNLLIQANLIHAAYVNQVKRLLFLGSRCIYPKLAPQPMKEEYLLTGPLEPTNRPYALAKIPGIEVCWSYNRQYGAQDLAAMPTNLTGPGDNYHPDNRHLIPALIRKFHEAKVAIAPSVTVWGTGAPRRKVMYSEDMAAACVHVMNLPDDKYASLLGSDESKTGKFEPPLINIGVGHDVTIKDLAQTVQKVVGFDGEMVFDTSKQARWHAAQAHGCEFVGEHGFDRQDRLCNGVGGGLPAVFGSGMTMWKKTLTRLQLIPARVACACLATFVTALPLTSLALDLGTLRWQPGTAGTPVAEIELKSMVPLRTDDVRASVASPAAYRVAGLEYDPGLAKVRLTPQTNREGRVVLRLERLPNIVKPLDLLIMVSDPARLLLMEYRVDPSRGAQEALPAPVGTRLGQLTSEATTPPSETVTTPVQPSAKTTPPVAPPPAPSLAAAGPPKAVETATAAALNDAQARTAVMAWAKAWSERNVKAYLAAYTPDFTGYRSDKAARSHQAWERERRERIEGRRHIAVEVKDLQLQAQKAGMTATFEQLYSSDGLTDRMRKRLVLVEVNGQWLIQREEAAP